jgi:hypothetical protein
VSITKARKALAASNNNESTAPAWLKNDLAISGAQKAAKIAHHAAGEGLVGASILARGPATGHSGVHAARRTQLQNGPIRATVQRTLPQPRCAHFHTAAFLPNPSPPTRAAAAAAVYVTPRTLVHAQGFEGQTFKDGLKGGPEGG